MWVIALVPLLVILLGVGLLLGGSDERKRIQGAPLAVAAQVPGGREVKLVGRAIADAPLIAPLSKEPCGFYRLVFLQYVRRGRTESLEEVHRAHVAADGFALADHTGKFRLDATTVDLRCEKVHTGRGGLWFGNAIDDVAAEHVGLDARTTVHEHAVPIGAPLLALGESVKLGSTFALGGPRLLLSVLPEARLLARDKGDAVGFALVAAGILGLAGCVFILLK